MHLQDRICDLIYAKAKAELERQIAASKTEEKAGMKQTLSVMVHDAMRVSREEVVEMIRKEAIDEASDCRRKMEQELNERAQELKQGLDEVAAWAAGSELAKLAAVAADHWSSHAIRPSESDRFGISQYNRSLGLVESAALGLKSIGASSESNETKR